MTYDESFVCFIKKIGTIEASFARTIPNKAGKATLRAVSPHHKSC
jgi:hypothetical protein